MLLGPVFDRFAAKSPVSVMARALLERALCPQELDVLFERCAEQQYTRELLFSTTADLLSQAVCGIRTSVHAAFQAAEDIAVSITSVYNKLAGVEASVSATLVRFCGDRLSPVIAALGAAPEWLPGYRARLLADLETLVPNNVHLVNLAPEIGANGAITLQIDLLGRSIADISEFIHRLEKSPVFQNISVSTEQKRQLQSVDFNVKLSVVYRPERQVQ